MSQRERSKSRGRMRTKRTGSRKLLLALLFMGACRSLSSDSGKRSGNDGLETTHSALTASTTLAQAVNGKIVAIVGAPGNLISAATTGDPSVGDDGSASYRIPIWVPDGINGLQPSLAVEYNSGSGTGVLGPRWRVTGLSVITRCGKTRAQDGSQAPVDWFGSTFCMDGQRLVAVSTSPSGIEFRTENDSFRKILGATDSSGNVTSFSVYQRDGGIFSYGSSLVNRQHGNPDAVGGGCCIASDVTYAWYLDRISDRYNNGIVINYTANYTNPTSGVDKVQELEPAQIAWGSGRSVAFAYEPLPTGVTVNPQMHWVHGLGIGNGTYLKTLTIKGPDGNGGTPLLKQYNFTYSATPANDTGVWVTGERVLSSISECDGNGVCKKPTTVTWSGGSNAYQKTDFGITDAAFANANYTSTSKFFPTAFSPYYQRIVAADLNGDGMDDVVYRNYINPHHAGFLDCVAWIARFTAVNTSGVVSLGAATPSAFASVGSDPDASCRAYLTSPTAYQTVAAGTAYPGDLLFSDLDGDGYVDILSPIGKGTGATNVLTSSVIAGYRAYLNGGAAHPAVFSNPINFIDSIGQPPSLGNFTTTKALMTGIADIDGDGIADILRPTENPPQHLRAATVSTASLTAKTETRNGIVFPYYECTTAAACNKVIPDAPQALTDVSLLDIDGDGTAEVLRNYPPCPSGWKCTPGATYVSSPTLNTSILVPPAAAITGAANMTSRWFVDLNGDGLEDVVWLASLSGTNQYVFWTGINTGYGFAAFHQTTATLASPPGNDPRVVDVNLDGRQDLLLNIPGATTSVALLSDGTGGLTAVNIPLPGAPYSTITQRVDRLVVDLNGDGLPDILQLEGTAPNIKLIGYTRLGKAPETVVSVAEGTGRQVGFTYDVSSSKDSTFYAVNSSQTCATDPQHLACLNRGRWMARSMTIGGPDTVATQQTFSYSGGVTDKGGRGFLGFMKRDIFGPGTRHTSISYGPTFRSALGSRYAYPFAMVPESILVDTNTSQGTRPHHYDTTYISYNSGWSSNGTFSTAPYNINNTHYDCASSNGTACTGPLRTLASDSEQFVTDGYGNVTTHATYHYDQNGAQMATETEVVNYLAPNTTNWLVNLPDPSRPSTFTSTSAANGESVTRTVKYTPDTTHGGITSIEVEPTGTADTHLLRTLARNPTNGVVTSISDQSPATGETRTTNFAYEAPDSVYVSTTTDALNHSTTVWRHPGLGLVVESDDANGLAATMAYDTFGRALSRTGFAGASATMTYQDGAGNGANVTLSPEGKATRAITLHYDSWGRETTRTTPVDGVQTLTRGQVFDAFGRLSQRVLQTGSTTLNTYSYGYDDLNRLLSYCHLSTDNLNHCRSNSYDGLTAISTDERGASVTHITDAMGRPSVQRALLQTGTSDATYVYGSFGQLEKETTSDGTAQTSLSYDVLGRGVFSKRLNADTRSTVYNAFGDVVATTKNGSAQVPGDETLNYGRDALGRVTSISTSTNSERSSTPVTRTFSWDVGTAFGNSIGKLVDVYDGINQEHFEYDANGLLHSETWNVSLFGNPVANLGVSIYYYDSQGRLQWLIYPANLDPGNDELEIFYTYDQYTGTVATLADGGDLSRPLWSAAGRNAFGQVTSETLQAVGTGTLLTKTNSYYSQNGLLRTASLTGTNGTEQLSYTYQANNLPSTLTMSGLGGVTASTYGYDNLSRLTSWQPIAGGPAVAYTYDSDGNMISRAWANGQSVTYGRSTSALTKTIAVGGVTTGTDNYSIDQWGRIYDTPAATLTYDAADEVTSVIEKGNGNQADKVIHDGLGNRLATTYGSTPGGSYLLTLMGDLYEFRYTSGANTKEERCRLVADGKVVGDVVRASVTTPPTSTFYLSDNVGSVVAEGAGTGTVTVRAMRDPFGNLITTPSSPSLVGDAPAANPDGTSRFGFGGHDRDPSWGLVDMKARLYSPVLGRFLSPDSIVADPLDRRDYNPFAYVHNTPTAFNDPTGHCQQPGNDGGGDPCGPDGENGGLGDPKGWWNAIKRGYNGVAKGVDWTGHELKVGGDWVGGVTKEGGESIGHYTKEAAEKVGHLVKEGWDHVFGGGSTPAPVTGPTAQMSATSANGSGSVNTGLFGSGTTGGGSPSSQVDSRGRSPAAEKEFAQSRELYQQATQLPGGVMLPTVSPNVDVVENMQLAAQHAYDPLWFATQVRTGGPWDYKEGTQHPELRDLGNFNYGAAGRAAGFSEDTLLQAAGAYQMWSGTSDPSFGNPLIGAWNGDSPRDQFWITAGSSLYDLSRSFP
jgi:RHS repeat-associated protein